MKGSTKITNGTEVLYKEEFQNSSIENTTVEVNSDMEDSYIYIRHNGSLERLRCSTICYLEAIGSYCNLYMSDNKKMMIPKSLGEIIDSLPVDTFIRVHRSYVINIDYVEKYVSNTFYIYEATIPIGRAYKKDALSHFNIVSKTIL